MAAWRTCVPLVPTFHIFSQINQPTFFWPVGQPNYISYKTHLNTTSRLQAALIRQNYPLRRRQSLFKLNICTKFSTLQA